MRVDALPTIFLRSSRLRVRRRRQRLPTATMLRAFRLAGPLAALAIGAATLAGCTAPALILTAAGIATDTSMTWEMVKHVHAQLTEDDPTPCAMLNSVQRALNGRCEFVPGSIRTADIAKSGLQACPLTAATQDARLWRALPELIEKGASYERCARSPLQDLAEIDACPNFQAASPEILKAIVYLADNDPRSVRHDVFRMLSCRNARIAGLDQVLVGWLDRGKLQPGTLSFSPLEALDPDVLVTRFGRELEVAGHLAQRRARSLRRQPADGLRGGAANEPLGRPRMVALRAAAARQPGAAEPRRADGLGAAAARAAARLPRQSGHARPTRFAS